MTLTYSYKEVPRSNKTHAKSPSIPVTLCGKSTKYDFTVLLDSGADVSALPKNVAELLGLDLSGDREEAFGIGGSVPAVQTRVHLEFGKPHERYSFSIPVKVILSEDDFPPLIGREVFFDKFKITFKQKESKVELRAETNKLY